MQWISDGNFSFFSSFLGLWCLLLFSWQRRSGPSITHPALTSTDLPVWPPRWNDSTICCRRRSASRFSEKYEEEILVNLMFPCHYLTLVPSTLKTLTLLQFLKSFFDSSNKRQSILFIQTPPIANQTQWGSSRLYSGCPTQVHLAMVRYHEAGRFCEKDEQWDQESAMYHLERAAMCGELEAIVALGQCCLQLPHHILPDMEMEVLCAIYFPFYCSA